MRVIAGRESIAAMFVGLGETESVRCKIILKFIDQLLAILQQGLAVSSSAPFCPSNILRISGHNNV